MKIIYLFKKMKIMLALSERMCYSNIAVARETTSNQKDFKKDKKVVDKLSNT